MLKGNLSRRGFIERTTAALTLAGLPSWFARAEAIAADQEAKPAEAKGPILMGAIGTGSRGQGVMQEAQKKGAQFVAVCDVDARHRKQAIEKLRKAGNESNIDEYNDFRELLDRKDIQAVTIVTPDHWHTLIAIEAMKRGKDIYCEKPLTLTVAEGIALVKVARAKNPVFQVGSQQRSDRRFRLACELVRNGRLGKIKTVETRIGKNPEGGPYPTAPVPEGLDWNFWLGQTPEVDYVERRCHYEFRWWYEYSGGKVTDWGAHHNDIAQWGLGMDGSGPVAIESEFTLPKHMEPNCYNCPPDFTITYTYAENASKYCDGTKLVCTGAGENGVKFIGENGDWIFVNRSKIEASDPKLLDEPLSEGAIRLYKSDDHMRNFLDCVRSRETPICPAEVGHRSVTVCHLGNISMRLGGRKLVWDPQQERFFGDALAQQMLSREMRAPWKLEV
ncbi:MAG: Gfo/Idh/MocA family oxidoreductase [Isosphaeraceae bacterium]|nr:Gfo/Idh/MocA family oxidoreductase [Isosphaeraceae bacterium]